MFLLVPASPGSPGQKAVKWLCVCVYTVILGCGSQLCKILYNVCDCVFTICLLLIFFLYSYIALCLQCFDTVGWAAGRASGL